MGVQLAPRFTTNTESNTLRLRTPQSSKSNRQHNHGYADDAEDATERQDHVPTLNLNDSSSNNNDNDRVVEDEAHDNSSSSRKWKQGAVASIAGAALFSVGFATGTSKGGEGISYAAAASTQQGGKSGKQSKSGKGLPTSPVITGRFSADTSTDPSSCYAKALIDLQSNNFAACSRYWYDGSTQDSTCAGTSSYRAVQAGNTPTNGNPGDNTCLGVGVSPICFELEGINDPVLVRTSVAWEWSEYIPPSTFGSDTCGPSIDGGGASLLPGNPCGRILTDKDIPLVSPLTIGTSPDAPAAGFGTTGQCYTFGPSPVVPQVTTITSTVTFTIDSNDYKCDVTNGGQVCEMWGYKNGYGNNFDSQFIPFYCPDILGDSYEGYISNVFDHNQLNPIENGIGKGAQIVLKKV